jgi:hypothetical protein
MKFLWLMLSVVLVMALALAFHLGGAFKPLPPPVLVVEVGPLSFTELKPDSGLTSARTFRIRNDGVSPLTGTLVTDQTWLQIDQSKFSINSGEDPITINVEVNTAGLKHGIKSTGSIIVNSNAGEKIVPVSISVPTSIITDDFSYPGTGWCVGSDDISKGQYSNGAYHLSVYKSGKYLVCANSILGQFSDFSYSVDANWANAAGANLGSYGVAFRQRDSINYYYFGVYPRQQVYSLSKEVNHNNVELVGTESEPLVPSPLINKDASGNRLGVVCSGPTISLYINNGFVKSVDDGAFSNGYVGLGVESLFIDIDHVEAVFQNLKIIVP